MSSHGSDRRRAGKRSRHDSGRLALERLEPRELLSTVTSNADAGPGTLREALKNAGAGETIDFNITSGDPIIVLESDLDPVFGRIIIDGSTQPGTRSVRIDGNQKVGVGLELHGADSELRNLSITRFKGDAIRLIGGGGSQILNCRIGTLFNGTEGFGNGGHGILIQNSSDNTIGGTQANNNIIKGSGDDGISIVSTFFDSAVGNKLLNNRIDDSGNNGNGGIGIDLDDDGPDDNSPDPDFGANRHQNYPTISKATTFDLNGSVYTQVEGSLFTGIPGNYLVQFFATRSPNSNRGFGEGGDYLVEKKVTIDSTGQVDLGVVDVGVVPAGYWVSATATNLGTNDTSEFSQATQVRLFTDRVDIAVTLVGYLDAAHTQEARLASVGQDIYYVATIRNRNNDFPSAPASLVSVLPGNLNYNGAVSSPVIVYDDVTRRLTADFGILPPSATRIIEFKGSPNAAGTVSVGFAAASGGIRDNNLANDSASWDTIAQLEPTSSVLQFLRPEFGVSESGNFATLTVVRSNYFQGTVSVGYETVDATAKNGTDYTEQQGSLTFEPGILSRNLVIPILSNTEFQPNRTLVVRLKTPSAGDSGGLALVGNPPSAILTIFDDDPPTPETEFLQFSQAEFSAQEDDDTATILVKRSGSAVGVVSVNFTTVDGTAIAGTNYVAKSGTITFPDGVNERPIEVTLIDNSVLNDTKTFGLKLSGSVAAVLGEQDTTSVHIIDDESPPAGFFQFSAPTFQATEGVGAKATITVTRQGGAGSASIAYQATAGTAQAGVRFEPTEGVLEFGPSDISKSFDVNLLDTSDFEGTQTVNLTLVASGNAALGSPSAAVLSILDDETPPPAVLQFSGATFSASEAAGVATITLTRTGGLAGSVAVTVQVTGGTATEGSDFGIVNQVVTFAENQATANFDIILNNDTEIEPDETVTFTLVSPSTGAVLGAQATTTLTIVSDDRDLTPPSVGGVSLGTVTTGSINSLVITFSEPVSPASLANATISVLALGRDGTPGTADDRLLAISSLSLDPTGRVLTITLAQGIPVGQFARLTIGGLTDLSGNPLDGDADGQPGGDFVSTFARGTTISYRDADGDFVTLGLRNGGLLEVTRNATGEGETVRLINPVPFRSVLFGSVRRGSGRGITTLQLIAGLDPFGRVRSSLRTPPFYVSRVTDAAGNDLNASQATAGVIRRPRR